MNRQGLEIDKNAIRMMFLNTHLDMFLFFGYVNMYDR